MATGHPPAERHHQPLISARALRWSHGRRRRQAAARQCHYQQRLHTIEGQPGKAKYVLAVPIVAQRVGNQRDLVHARSATEIPRLVVAGVLPTARQTPHALRVQRPTGTRGRQRRSSPPN
ncbi:hypothetical protein ACFXC8_43070 [Streptomyces sp. NPDC059441]|uniref:hypothetical protein n=1 Tax=Streptomyces sp. NPDC059441 TaxID=3346829 RepID=UPI003681DCA9